jgi:hypothetical protein
MKTLSLATLAVMTAALGFSEVIYNSGPVDPGTGATGSDLKTTSDGLFPRQIADVFSLQSAAQVTGLSWWGGYFPAGTAPTEDHFTVRVFGDIGGNPGSSPLWQFPPGQVDRTTTGLMSGALPVYLYSLNVPSPFLLAAGTYWLSVVNDTTGDPDDRWFWSRNGHPTFPVTIRERLADDTAWGPYSFTTIAPQAFVVSGVAVPEPRMVAVFVLVGGMLLRSGLRLRSRSPRTRAGM